MEGSTPTDAKLCTVVMSSLPYGINLMCWKLKHEEGEEEGWMAEKIVLFMISHGLRGCIAS